MADEPAEPKRKRRVKNPETFRERALKASAESEQKPNRKTRAAKSGGKLTGKASKPLRGLARFKLFRVLGRILVPTYLRNSWKELKLVTWPSWKESRQLTFAVLVFAIVFGAAIAIVDYGLDKVFRNILLK